MFLVGDSIIISARPASVTFAGAVRGIFMAFGDGSVDYLVRMGFHNVNKLVVVRTCSHVTHNTHLVWRQMTTRLYCKVQ